MAYSRAHPSPRYVELRGLYRKMHEEGEVHSGKVPEQTFPGASLPPQAGRIKKLIERTGARTLLDYGAGKGFQYRMTNFEDADGRTWPGIVDYWGVASVDCYDPGYAPFDRLPTETFDGVISTDVLEHCPEEDLPWILEEMFGYASRFVFTNVACYPASKRLANGENAHCTVKPPEWWRDVIEAVAARRPGLLWETWMDVPVQTPDGPRWTERKFGNT